MDQHQRPHSSNQHASTSDKLPSPRANGEIQTLSVAMQATTISEVADFIRGIELIVTEVVEQWLQTLADPRARRLLHALYVEQDPAQVTAAIESLRDHPLGGGEAVLDSFYQAAAIGLNVYFFMLGEKSPDDIRAFIDDTIRGVPKIIIQISHEA